MLPKELKKMSSSCEAALIGRPLMVIVVLPFFSDRVRVFSISAGQSGAIGAPGAVINAVLDALAPLGVRDLNPPLTPERIWTALREATAGQAPVDE